MNNIENLEKTICENCQNTIITYNNYPVWCDKCEWNLEYKENIISKTPLDNIYNKLSEKYGNNLFNTLKQQVIVFKPKKLSKMELTVYIISISIILLNISFSIIGIYLIIYGVNLFIKFLGFIFFGIFYISKPKFHSMPKNYFISKKDFSELYNAVNSVCKTFNTSEVEGIIIDYEFNASITEYGLKKRKVLFLGLPLLTVLDNKEKMDLIGHEIAHCINNDITRNKVVSTAIHILINTGKSIYPSNLENDISFYFINSTRSFILVISRYLVVPINLIIRGISHLLWKAAYILNSMVWLDSQKAEYFADILGSKISGKKSSISGMKKLSYNSIFFFEFEKAVLKGKNYYINLDLFEIIRNKINNLPKHEKERLERLQKKETHRIDVKHPPTYSRILLLENNGFEEEIDVIKNINFNKLNQELKNIEPIIQNVIIDLFRDSKYY